MTLLKGLGGMLTAVTLLALCLLLITVQSCRSIFHPIFIPGSGPPSIGDCSNVGISYPDNPFSGWPVVGGPNWGLVTAMYCDPAYYQQFGVHHFGIDLGYPEGTAVIATAAGEVIAAGWQAQMGNYVRVCANDWCSTYMHLSAILVEEGNMVNPGDILGVVGSTGNSTGPHLHYQINDPNWFTVDPAPTLQ